MLLLACGATLAPKQLVDARTAYARASRGPAVALAPAQLDTAKQALQAAEQSFAEEGTDPVTVDLAYIALRRVELAEAEAAREAADRERAAIDKESKTIQVAGLERTQEQLEQERRARQAGQAEVERTKAELETERKRSAEVEKKLSAAMASMAEVAKVKEEARGIVITLSGSVLFATAKSELLPIAKEKLDEVVKALTDQGYGGIIVEGHTDSRGRADANQTLSLQRAEAVRTHLVSRGIPSEKIRAVGLGSSRPVADNATAEGRANNRRVELIVEPEKK
ncbi:MAG: OmpA family protein [Polyangiaceae bacterium]|nr:OmpA family protein [Polyangiaceae bacterium]